MLQYYTLYFACFDATFFMMKSHVCEKLRNRQFPPNERNESKIITRTGAILATSSCGAWLARARIVAAEAFTVVPSLLR